MYGVQESQNLNLRRLEAKSHQILSTYINHLVRARRETDLEAFDALINGASTEARKVLEKFRNNHAGAACTQFRTRRFADAGRKTGGASARLHHPLWQS
jgi:hypothetical protein